MPKCGLCETTLEYGVTHSCSKRTGPITPLLSHAQLRALVWAVWVPECGFNYDLVDLKMKEFDRRFTPKEPE